MCSSVVGGGLGAQQGAEVERLGRALMDLDTTFDELIEHFGVQPDDVYLPLDLDALLRTGSGPHDRDEPTRRTT